MRKMLQSIHSRSATPMVLLLKSRPSTPMGIFPSRRPPQQPPTTFSTSVTSLPAVPVSGAAATTTMSALSGAQKRGSDGSVIVPSTPQQSNNSNVRGYHSRKTPDNRVRKCKAITQNPDGTWTVSARYGKVIILALGEILADDGNYATDRYIFPVGFKSSRTFASTTDPTNEHVEYISSIERTDQGPSVGFPMIFIIF